MKRKTQFLLFALIISCITFIVIFVGINIKRNNILPENTNVETENNALLEKTINAKVKDNLVLEEDTVKVMKFSIMATTILPPGSTSEDLQTAIYNATSGDTIILSDNITYATTSPAIIIPADKEITIRV